MNVFYWGHGERYTLEMQCLLFFPEHKFSYFSASAALGEESFAQSTAFWKNGLLYVATRIFLNHKFGENETALTAKDDLKAAVARSFYACASKLLEKFPPGGP
jgi:hypothetical protein